MFNRLKGRKEKVDFSKGHELLDTVVEVPDGMFEKCPNCGHIEETSKLQQNAWVCEQCNYHYRLHIAQRIHLIFDEFKIFNHIIKSKDPLDFPGYQAKLNELSETLGVYDAVVCGEAVLDGKEVIGVVMDTNFMMGSMGSVVGEKITRAFERAERQKKPLILFSASGGARMQEGIISLMQMAKTSGAVGNFSKKGGLFINVLTDPTTGGVTASFAMLADIILAEPGALIGFAGPRVIKQTMKKELPDGFQRAEFLQDKGFVDKIVKRSDLKKTLSQLLSYHEVKS